MNDIANTLIGTTIHDEPVEVVARRNGWTVLLDTIQTGAPFACEAKAIAYARQFVPAHRLAA